MGTLTATVRYIVAYDVDVEVEADTRDAADSAFEEYLQMGELDRSEKYKTSTGEYVFTSPVVIDTEVEYDDDAEWAGDEDDPAYDENLPKMGD